MVYRPLLVAYDTSFFFLFVLLYTTGPDDFAIACQAFSLPSTIPVLFFGGGLNVLAGSGTQLDMYWTLGTGT